MKSPGLSRRRFAGAAMHSDGVGFATAGTWITSPIWLEFLEPTYQGMLALLGFILLLLTIRNKWLDLKIKRATLAEIASNIEGATDQEPGRASASRETNGGIDTHGS